MLSQLRLLTKVIRYTFEIWIVDWLPNTFRRRILAAEYSGEKLERRLQMRIGGGWRMVRALWRFTSVHHNIKAEVGMTVPTIAVESANLRRGDRGDHVAAEVTMASLGTPGRVYAPEHGRDYALECVGTPDDLLVLNFGSCT